MTKLQGTVVSDKMQKTVVVRVDTLKMHAKYRKQYKVSKKFKAHDENKEYRIGDVVEIEETRPLSREKRWKVVRLIKRPLVVEHLDASIDGETINA